MRRRSVLLSAVSGALTGALAASRTTTAQEATPSALAQHPIVGAWRWTNAPDDPVPYTYAIFHDDGTYLEVTMGVGSIIGAWQPTGERTVEVTSFAQDIDPSVEGVEPGTIKTDFAATITEDGTTATALYRVQVATPDGTVMFTSDVMEGTLARIEVDSMDVMGTPVTGTPTS